MSSTEWRQQGLVVLSVPPSVRGTDETYHCNKIHLITFNITVYISTLPEYFWIHPTFIPVNSFPCRVHCLTVFLVEFIVWPWPTWETPIQPPTISEKSRREKLLTNITVLRAFAYFISSIRTITHEFLIVELKIVYQDVTGGKRER